MLDFLADFFFECIGAAFEIAVGEWIDETFFGKLLNALHHEPRKLTNEAEAGSPPLFRFAGSIPIKRIRGQLIRCDEVAPPEFLLARLHYRGDC